MRYRRAQADLSVGIVAATGQVTAQIGLPRIQIQRSPPGLDRHNTPGGVALAVVELDAARSEVGVAVGVVRVNRQDAAIHVHRAQRITGLLATGRQIEPRLDRVRVQVHRLLKVVDRQGVLTATGELSPSGQGFMEPLGSLPGR